MKLFTPVALLAPVVLSGCATNTPTPPRVPAQAFVTSLLQDQIPIIQRAQTDLAQASRVRLQPEPPVRSPTTSVTATPSREPPKSSQPKTLVGQPVLTLQAIRYLGKRPAHVGLARTGKAQTLRQALSQIAPNGWQVSFSQELTPDARGALHWAGNDQWPFVLDGVLQQQGKVALIDWQAQRISVADKSAGFTPGAATTAATSKPLSPANVSTASNVPTSIPTASATTAKAPTTTAIPGRNPFGGNKPTAANVTTVHTPVPVALPKPAITPTVWRIEAGSTLKDTLFSWAAAETCATSGGTHWTVAWLTSANYRIDAPLQFEGSFRDALNSLFTLYGTAQVPLYAGIRQAQCVISVDDKELR
ncbi:MULTISPECIES: toxin co-regulated pilus biosynthesis Q family protein [unclassified Serratia (in: enterobacteria)]|uniref:toxin co-regulated pilus biosynthesis Q family protein n=1 Tax=unclassified Serratia (in: enterobacteria) TaxID=2647522 RepID=UPI0030767D53